LRSDPGQAIIYAWPFADYLLHLAVEPH
jgi:hypothetical protein